MFSRVGCALLEFFTPKKPLEVFHAHLSLSWVIVFVLLMFLWGFVPKKKSVKWVRSDKKSGMRGAAFESLKSLWILLGVPERTASLEAWCRTGCVIEIRILCSITVHSNLLVEWSMALSWQFPAITELMPYSSWVKQQEIPAGVWMQISLWSWWCDKSNFTNMSFLFHHGNVSYSSRYLLKVPFLKNIKG